MIQLNRALIFFICGLMLTMRPASGQSANKGLIDSMLDCTMHEEGGPWVPEDLRRDGLLRFSYLYEPPKKNPGEYDDHDNEHRLYVAFWNPERSKGEFLDFSLDRLGSRRLLIITNQGDIYYTDGKLDMDVFQGGVWMHRHYMIRLAKLRATPVQTVSVRKIRSGLALCESPWHWHPEWHTRPPAKAPTKK
jgi:hypothetical protein